MRFSDHMCSQTWGFGRCLQCDPRANRARFLQGEGAGKAFQDCSRPSHASSGFRDSPFSKTLGLKGIEFGACCWLLRMGALIEMVMAFGSSWVLFTFSDALLITQRTRIQLRFNERQDWFLRDLSRRSGSACNDGEINLYFSRSDIFTFLPEDYEM